MTRLTLLTATLVLVVLIFSAPMPAQVYGTAPSAGGYGTYGVYAPGFYAPGYYGGAAPIVGTPEVHLGSATEPSIVRIPPVIMQTPVPRFDAPEYADYESAAMQRPFDFLVSPVGGFYPGSMDDSSVSLGDYAREVRSQKHGPPPIVLKP